MSCAYSVIYWNHIPGAFIAFVPVEFYHPLLSGDSEHAPTPNLNPFVKGITPEIIK